MRPPLASVAIVLPVSLFAAALLIVIAACGGDSDSDPTPSRTTGPVPSLEFIDSHPIRGGEWDGLIPGRLLDLVGGAETVALIEVLEIVETRGWRNRYLTVYRARVEEWVKGGDGTEVLVVGEGADVRGGWQDVLDGYFLMEPGHRYVVTMDSGSGNSPATADYVWRGGGWSNFQVTDDFVHVLNNPLTRSVQEEYGGMPLDEFLSLLNELVTSP